MTLSLNGYRDVVEIGPGTGILTRFLLERDLRLTAIDIDPESIAYLRDNFPGEMDKLQILEADFLSYDLTHLYPGRLFAITGNFPYNISSQIVFKTIENRHRVPEFSGMFQKEVAQRICAAEGSKTYGILSVWTQAFYEAEYLFTVGPEVFDPPPKVESGVLRLVRRSDYRLNCDEALLLRVIKTAFNQRRKTLRNSLKPLAIPQDLKEDAIFDLRPEQLSVTDFIALTKMIENDTV